MLIMEMETIWKAKERNSNILEQPTPGNKGLDYFDKVNVTHIKN